VQNKRFEQEGAEHAKKRPEERISGKVNLPHLPNPKEGQQTDLKVPDIFVKNQTGIQ
jgi:hypothetical protein